MARLAISLFGCFRATQDGDPLTGIVSDKGRALLAYLVIESDRPHRRASLATLLWSERPEALARANLRQTLHRLREALNATARDPPYLLITPQDIQFNCQSDCWVDVSAFSQAVAVCLNHHPQGSALCQECANRLQEAVDLYRGDLLAGFCIPNSPRYEWWLLSKQEEYHRQAIEILAHLAEHYEHIPDYTRVIQTAQRAIELEPWREFAHRQKMRALALAGQRRAALRQYELLQQILAVELGVAPALETIRLFEEISTGALQPAAEEP